jgi:hypothetical protein
MYIIYSLLFVIRFDKSVGIVAHVIMFFVSLLFLISLFFKVSCSIFSHLSTGTLRSQCEAIQSHLTPTINICPINGRKPLELPSPSLAVFL